VSQVQIPRGRRWRRDSLPLPLPRWNFARNEKELRSAIDFPVSLPLCARVCVCACSCGHLAALARKRKRQGESQLDEPRDSRASYPSDELLVPE